MSIVGSLAVTSWLLVAAAGQTATPPDRGEEAGDEVVVTANKRRCDLTIANRLLSDREFRARSREWAAGRPVRIVVPAGASYRCQAKIIFRLGKYGVNRAVFVDR